jgi:hypothetical protein
MQYINFVTSRENPMPSNGLDLIRGDNTQTFGSEALNITSVVHLWIRTQMALLQLIAPFHQRTFLLPSCEANNLSRISLAYVSYFNDLFLSYGASQLLIFNPRVSWSTRKHTG